MTIAITGATGQLGRIVVAKLKGKIPAVDIVALARSPAKAADLGVTVREADYAKPETLAAALAGVETLLLISSSELRRTGPPRNEATASSGFEGGGFLRRDASEAAVTLLRIARRLRSGKFWLSPIKIKMQSTKLPASSPISCAAPMSRPPPISASM
jgi:NAD(P)H dehydrogenase (quinone)